MKITIETIPHETQRYATVGDWYYDKDETLCIKVSALSDWRREVLVAIHELVEVVLCKHNGVSTELVDEFDIQFEKARIEGDESEPGDDPKAPYRKEHCVATGVERILAAELGVDWKPYEQELCSLPEIEGPWHKPKE